MVVEGEIEFDGQMIGRRDSIEIITENEIKFKAYRNSEVLLIEIPLVF